MRNRFVVSYDVCDAKRLRRVHKKLRGFGDHVQYSVFRCDLSAKEKVLLIETLSEEIDFEEDQVLIVDLGPAQGRGEGCIEVLGRPSVVPQVAAVVI